jgi:hypothetical protein
MEKRGPVNLIGFFKKTIFDHFTGNLFKKDDEQSSVGCKYICTRK